MNIIEKYDRPFEYAEILMNIFIAYQFYSLWSSPTNGDVGHIYSLVGLISFEVVMVQSGLLFTVLPKRISLFMLVPFYGLFVYFFNKILPNNSILITYSIFILNRIRFAFSDASIAIKKRSAFRSAIALSAYFVLIFAIAFNAEVIPELGLTEAYLNELGYVSMKKAGGLFFDFPHTALCMGFVYYCLLAILESILLNMKFRNKPNYYFKR